MDLKNSLTEKSKGHFKYESMLKAMPPDIVKELARRWLEEVERYQAAKKTKRSLTKKKQLWNSWRKAVDLNNNR